MNVGKYKDNNGEEKTYHDISKLELADIMQELAIMRQRLYLIKSAFAENDPMIAPGVATRRFD